MCHSVCLRLCHCLYTDDHYITYYNDITTAQRSKSVHTSPTADDDSGDDHKPKLSRRSSDTTSPTLLSDDEEDEVVKVVKREFQVRM